MKLTLTTLVAIIGAASAISVDAGLVKRQCIANGGLCFTSIADTTKPCCGGLICKNKPQPNTNICEPEESPKVGVSKREVVEKSDIPPAPQAQAMPRAMPRVPRDEPIWG
ncbi:EC20 protein [Colletotrichum tofieldiae]|uniref:EC20 protein n=1 Tax=Colletotrichum tofieldiae TaxID=708197 RepID=A0A161W4S3_9PEZI|nr:EC20 protein [Colletotrichum tofieldiae]GKT55835.1 EC20 protein [Colletotrichum tofieldiae]GKT79327.1 EC20 protein [Colletotrichum tofieldiae]GKT82497.1 EC20 protein [Colletotrichum tofieldiae]